MVKLLTGILFFIAFPLFAVSQGLLEFLKSQDGIKAVSPIDGNSFFQAVYEIMVRQPLDHNDTTRGFFLQRVVVSDKGAANPVVVITEGYNANYATRPSFIHELSPILNANQICVEHRYFGKSVPSPLNWAYLTVQDATGDQHRIIQLFKKYYQAKWVSTGISKGGQAAMSHRSLFPTDVDATVAYVGPVNFAVEDGRHGPFIAREAGNARQRKAVLNFQKETFRRKGTLLPLLKEFSEEKNYTYRIPLEEVFDFCVLEYSFSFWQWGHPVEEIPATTASDNEIFAYLVKVASPDYFSKEGSEPTLPFFVQAAHELGYYGYDTRKFRKWLTIPNARDYLSKIFLPEGMFPVFNPESMTGLHQFIQGTDANMMFIYGENDPWTASGAVVPRKENLIKAVLPGGNHRTRINSFPEEQKEQLKRKLKEWVGATEF